MCLLAFPISTAVVLALVSIHPNLWMLFGGMVVIKVSKKKGRRAKEKMNREREKKN